MKKDLSRAYDLDCGCIDDLINDAEIYCKNHLSIVINHWRDEHPQEADSIDCLLNSLEDYIVDEGLNIFLDEECVCFDI